MWLLMQVEFEVALSLINEFGCDPNKVGFHNRTLLHMASQGGCNSLVQALLKSMSPMLTDDYGDTPLHLASIIGQARLCGIFGTC